MRVAIAIWSRLAGGDIVAHRLPECRLFEAKPPDGIQCGAGIRCSGGCSGSVADPRCVSEFTPPTCHVDMVCHDACSARVTANAVCDPTRVDVFVAVDAGTSAELEALEVSLEKHLPILIDAVHKDGRLLLDSGRRLIDSGSRLEDRIDDLNGKSFACLGASIPLVTRSVTSINVCVQASARLTLLLEQNSI